MQKHPNRQGVHETFPHDSVVAYDGHHWPRGVGGVIVLAVQLVVVQG